MRLGVAGVEMVVLEEPHRYRGGGIRISLGLYRLFLSFLSYDTNRQGGMG